jgi:uncharacterized protein YbaP (TraB family)
MFARFRRALSRLTLKPATLALALVLGLSVPAAAEPALWKIQGPHATIYLFGTIHVLKPNLGWESPRIATALKDSGSLWLEVNNADDPAVMQPLVMKYGLDPAHPLSTKLDAGSKAKLAALLTPLGVTPAQFEPFRPWMAATAITVLPIVKAGYNLDSGAEHVVTAEMKTANKPVLGFETAEEQIRYLADTPPEVELAFFKSSLDEAEKAVPMIDDMVSSWMAGDETKLEEVLNADIKDDYPDLYQRLIVARNRRFAAQIAKLAQGEGTVFVAIGAAHLVGADSVQADLKGMGIEAVRQ